MGSMRSSWSDSMYAMTSSPKVMNSPSKKRFIRNICPGNHRNHQLEQYTDMLLIIIVIQRRSYFAHSWEKASLLTLPCPVAIQPTPNLQSGCCWWLSYFIWERLSMSLYFIYYHLPKSQNTQPLKYFLTLLKGSENIGQWIGTDAW